jgi:tetratricopeptide (TPR) repeat protein
MKRATATPHEKPHHPHWPLAALLFAFVFALGMLAVREPSTWIRIKVGARILADGTLPRVEPFSYGASGSRWTTHSWLTDVLFAKLDAAGGPGLVAAFTSAAIAGAFALLLPINHGNPMVAASLLSVGACASWTGMSGTPFAFDFLFFALFLRLLRPRHRFHAADAVWAVALTALWANLHGASAPLGLGLVFLKVFKTSMRTAARERLGYWVMFVTCALAFSWNPHGYGILFHAFSDAASGAAAWRTPLASPYGLFLLGGLASCWFTLQAEFVTTLAAATVLALSIVLPGLRPLAVLAACPVAALALGHALRPRDDTWPRVLRWCVFAALLLGAYVQLVTRPLAPSVGYGAPALSGAVHFLNASGVRGRMFNEPETGAELIGLTDRSVFVDQRLALYPEVFAREASEWTRLFHALDAVYRFDYAVVRNKRVSEPARILDEDPEWRLAYADDRALVYLKKTGANAWLVTQSPFRRLTPNRLDPGALDAALADPRQAPSVLEELDRWTVSAPDCAQALLWKAYALNRLKMGDKADRLVDLARERPILEWDPELQTLEARVLEARGRVDEARLLYRRAARGARRLDERALAETDDAKGRALQASATAGGPVR